MTDTHVAESPQIIGPMTRAQIAESARYRPDEAPFGRPTGYNEETADLICDRLADGDSLKQICEDERIPRRSTVYNWLDAHPDFMDKYQRARSWQADSHADDIIYIVDTEEDPRKAQVRMNARIWHASKMKPKTYGDHKSLSVEHTVTLTDEQLAKRIGSLQNQMTIDGTCEEAEIVPQITDANGSSE